MRKYIDANEFWNRLISVSENDWVGFDTIDEVLSGMPAEPRWIPVTERLPEKYGQYLVTLEDEDYIRVMPLYYGRINSKDTFYDSANEYGDIKCRRVIAWMPFPEPYKGGDETKHGEWKIDGFEDLDDGTSQMIVRCSVCGNTQGVLTNYCPNCGAKMDEVEMNEN